MGSNALFFLTIESDVELKFETVEKADRLGGVGGIFQITASSAHAQACAPNFHWLVKQIASIYKHRIFARESVRHTKISCFCFNRVSNMIFWIVLGIKQFL